jgi:hypothetical protein
MLIPELDEIITGLNDLIKDRQTFISGDEEFDNIFKYDSEILTTAVKVVELVKSL